MAGKGREKLTKEGIEDALRLCRVGMTDKDIAAYLGVAPETYSRWINHPRTDNQRQLCQAMKKGEVERKAALVLSKAVFLGEKLVREGETDADKLVSEMKACIEAEKLAKIDYVSAVDAVTMESIHRIDRPVLVAMAVYIGKTRLIDNFLTEDCAK